MDELRLVVGVVGLVLGGYFVWLWSQDRRGIRRHVRPGFNRNWLLVIAAVCTLNGAWLVLQGLLVL